MKQGTLLVLGASADQLYLIETAQQMGLSVLALDQNPASPGFALADEHAVVSTRDVEGIVTFLRTRPGPAPIGVLTMGSDIPDVVSAVAGYLGTPALSAQAAHLTTDKLAMKECLAAAGIAVPWFREVFSTAEVEMLFAERGPLVLKPIDRSGSRGVFLLDGSSDFADLFRRAREFSYCGRVLVEEFLKGPQISTESILAGSWAATPGYADRNYELLERFRPQIMENGGWVPSAFEDRRPETSRLVERAARALGITHGVAKGDVVLTPEGPFVIEIAGRLSGGDFCAGLVPWGSGVNYVRSAVQLAIGQAPDVADLTPRFEQAVANRYFFPPPGRLLGVDGVEEVEAQEWVTKLEFWYEVGDEIPESLSHAHRFGVFVVVGPDRATAQERVDWVYRTIRIRVEARDERLGFETQSPLVSELP